MALSEAPASLAARAFAAPSYKKALFQFGHTILLYGVAIFLMFQLLPTSWWLSLAVAPVAVAAYLRLFMIGHDCAHRSYLPKRWQNNLLGNLVGVLTNTPLLYWGSQHAMHHRTTGNLDRRGAGDVNTMTVEEYRLASLPARIWYRIYRNPFMLMVVFAPIYFIFMLRLPLEQKKPSRAIWYSVVGTNLGISLYYGTLIWLVGVESFLLVFGPVVFLSSVGAVWLFYIQHQFEDAYWQRDADWNYHDATLYGSSFYDLPRWAHWATGNIGYHHIHHLNPRVPNYSLAACYASDPAVRDAKSISFLQSLSLGRLALWDEAAGRMIRFDELDQAGSQVPLSS
ncbi:MAG: fatty acid desaturase [Pseudomonadota bacterium]